MKRLEGVLANFANNNIKLITNNNNKIYLSERNIVHLLPSDPIHTLSVLMGPLVEVKSLHGNAPCAQITMWSPKVGLHDDTATGVCHMVTPFIVTTLKKLTTKIKYS